MRTCSKIAASLSLFLILTGCSTNSPKTVASGPPSEAPAAPNYSGEYPSGSTEHRSEGAGRPYHGEAHDAGSPRSADEAYQHKGRSWASRERPGLATSFGESRRSPIESTYFERQHGSEPSDGTAIRYDDEEGVRSLLRESRLRESPHFVPLLGGALSVSVVDDDDDPLPSVYYGGQSVVMGEDGDRYQIRVINHTGARFEIVASVDGLDVMDGSPASSEKRGYLVLPYQELMIEGFRVSYEQVAAFRFGSVSESYAAYRGGAQNVGVIGVLAFSEKSGPFGDPYREEELRRRAEPFPGGGFHRDFARPPGR